MATNNSGESTGRLPPLPRPGKKALEASHRRKDLPQDPLTQQRGERQRHRSLQRGERSGDGEGAGDRGRACGGHRPAPHLLDGLAERRRGDNSGKALIHCYNSGSSGRGGRGGRGRGLWWDEMGREPEGPMGKGSEGSAGIAGVPKLLTFPGCQSGSCLFYKLKNKGKLGQKGNGKCRLKALHPTYPHPGAGENQWLGK